MHCGPSDDRLVRGRHSRDDVDREDRDRSTRAVADAPASKRLDTHEERRTALMLEHPEAAPHLDLLTMQHAAGNAALQRLVLHATPAGSGPTQLPDGPYSGPIRRNNPKMDWFQDHQNVFMPHIFREYGPNRALWAPLDGFLRTYLVTNEQTESGLSLSAPAVNQAAYAIIQRLAPAKVPDIRERKSQRERDSALLDAIIAAFDAEYRPAFNRCNRDWFSRSRFRLFHEWGAVRFGLVQKPYAWWQRP